MTSPTDRIAAVLLAHDPGTTACCSGCGAPADTRELHAAHVAERIEAELQPEQNRQLAEAWQAGYREAKRR